MKEPRTTTLVDAFERADGSTPATPAPPSAANGKAVHLGAQAPEAAPRAPSPDTREPSARMRMWCSEE